jgi:hypothetical protein
VGDADSGGAHRPRRHVDGRLGETSAREEDFESEGNFVVGRGLSRNEFFQGLDGTVDDVRALASIPAAEGRSGRCCWCAESGSAEVIW